MKKSEMIKSISDWLIFNAPGEYCHYSTYGLGLEAKNLLDMLEEKGMLPPFSNKAAQKSCQIDAPGFEWEEE